MKVGRWSTTPGSNNSTPPDGWPEGQAPSTVNDCAREMMASIRAMVNDLQYVDQDMTPTYVSATTFSVPGNQTSAIHAGRRLKLFDATAGLGVVLYATVTTASFTAVTNITIDVDSGALTSSLSSFAIAVLSNTNNSIPRDLVLTVSAVAVAGTMSVSGASVLGGTLSVSGQAAFAAGLSVSATANVGVLQARNSSLTCVAAGGFICTGDVLAFSDARLKTDWVGLDPDFVAKIAGLQAGSFTRIDSGHRQVGIPAQAFRKIMPEAVHGDEYTGHLSIAYGQAVMVTCVELAKEVMRLRELIK